MQSKPPNKITMNVNLLVFLVGKCTTDLNESASATRTPLVRVPPSLPCPWFPATRPPSCSVTALH
ncbi:hypothetical protein PR002_g6931 [Phytophthora rubi]|nr:hypothetical protein PR002_g6931 [Phytophthora rubi]